MLNHVYKNQHGQWVCWMSTDRKNNLGNNICTKYTHCCRSNRQVLQHLVLDEWSFVLMDVLLLTACCAASAIPARFIPVGLFDCKLAHTIKGPKEAK